MFYNATDNWLLGVKDLKKDEVLTISNLGNLTQKSVDNAVIAQYGKGNYWVVKHGSVIYIHPRERYNHD